MERKDIGLAGCLLLLLLLVSTYPFVASGVLGDVYYDVVGAAATALAWCGTRRRPPVQRKAWRLCVLGFAVWVVGDLVYSVEHNALHLTGYPLSSDGLYLSSYPLLAVGLLSLVRGRRSQHDLSALVGAAIVATGAGIVVGVFVLAPIAASSTLTLAGQLVGSCYPLGDVLLVAILFRVWVTPGTRSTSARLLACALLATLAADIVYNVSLFTTSSPLSTPWNDTLWLLGYLLLATATSWPRGSDDPPAHVAGSRAEPVRARTQLVALTGGLLLPAVALLVDGADDGPVQWAVIGVGSVVLSLLVPARMAALLRVVEVQSVQLAALARSDALTGAPNRRTWDHELSRACQRARDGGEPLSIALLDLDRFKLYNDAHGHQAGDLLLREAVARWTDLLEAGDLLARYGGEEFAVLMPGRSLVEARARLDRLREATPSGQTFSAGVAVWDPATEPADALRLADEALYDAKRAGRDQVRVSGRVAPAPRLPVPVAVLQPIVDLRTGVMVAMEALSRFDGESPVAAFERAQREGLGPELEAAAIRAALLCRPAEVVMTLNVSLAALVHPAIVAALPADLHGITLEITEHSDASADPSLEAALADVRARGARLAVDDWGRGFSNMDRMLRLRPEVVKIDMSLVHGLDSDYHRAMVRSVTAWADEVGATVCAEGVETEEQRITLLQLGVHTAQGYLFGPPAAPGTYTGSHDPERADTPGVVPGVPAVPR